MLQRTKCSFFKNQLGSYRNTIDLFTLSAGTVAVVAGAVLIQITGRTGSPSRIESFGLLARQEGTVADYVLEEGENNENGCQDEALKSYGDFDTKRYFGQGDIADIYECDDGENRVNNENYIVKITDGCAIDLLHPRGFHFL